MPPSPHPHPIAALLRFHVHVGVRVALRAAAPLVALLVAVIGLSPEPARWPSQAGRALLVPDVDPALQLFATVAALGLSAWAAGRMSLRPGSWLRHLPAGESAHRRAGILGLAVAQLPLSLTLALLWIGARLGGAPVEAAILLAWSLATVSAAAAAWPCRRRWLAAPVGALGALLGFGGGATGALAGFGGGATGALAAASAILVVDLLGGPARSVRRRAPREQVSIGGLEMWIAWRALGWGPAGACAASLLPVCASALALTNNGLEGAWGTMVARLGATLSVALLMGELAHQMTVRRPHWPWVRSLPRPAASRARADAFFLGLHAIPGLAAAAWLDPAAAAGALLIVPALALVAAREIRAEVASRSIVAVRVFAWGLAAALLHGLFVGLPLAALAALPLLDRRAAEEDRRARVTLWREAGHLPSGDSLSWSGE